MDLIQIACVLRRKLGPSGKMTITVGDDGVRISISRLGTWDTSLTFPWWKIGDLDYNIGYDILQAVDDLTRDKR